MGASAAVLAPRAAGPKANNVRFQTIGRVEALPREVCDDIDNAIVETAANLDMTLTIAPNYGGRTEIVDAVNDLLRRARQLGEPRQIDEHEFSDTLSTSSIGDPDLLIRTSGEFRLSNFLLWQIAYSEIWVTDRLWPDFRTTDLLEALSSYQQRNRRFGGLPDEPAARQIKSERAEAKLVGVNE